MPVTFPPEYSHFIHPWSGVSKVTFLMGFFPCLSEFFPTFIWILPCFYLNSSLLLSTFFPQVPSRGLAIRRWIKSSGDLRRYTKVYLRKPARKWIDRFRDEYSTKQNPRILSDRQWQSWSRGLFESKSAETAESAEDTHPCIPDSHEKTECQGVSPYEGE